jgi:hypothetical protein
MCAEEIHPAGWYVPDLMLARSDRREWAVLGLVALGWCLLVAPLLHRQTHVEGTKHTHGAPAQSERNHGEGSFEHQLAVFVAPPAAPVVFGDFTALASLELRAPRAPWIVELRRVEQAQAP